MWRPDRAASGRQLPVAAGAPDRGVAGQPCRRSGHLRGGRPLRRAPGCRDSSAALRCTPDVGPWPIGRCGGWRGRLRPGGQDRPGPGRRRFPPPADAAIKPLEKSACNPLSGLTKKSGLCGLRREGVARAGEKEAGERAKRGSKGGGTAAGGVRRHSREPQRTRASTRKKGQPRVVGLSGLVEGTPIYRNSVSKLALLVTP